MTGGDVYWARPDLAVGHEQQGRRPVVVLSELPIGNLVIVAPLTTSLRDWATRVRVDHQGRAADIMCEQVRSISTSRLSDAPHASVDHETLTEARSIVARLVGVYR